MGKRSERYSRNKITAVTGKLLGKDIHVVMNTGRTYFGTLISADEEILQIQDKNIVWYNKKKHTHHLIIKDIEEVILEREAEW